VYDVVVVGGGAAGCVVAARAAERGSAVLLLEAGPDLRPDIPASRRDGWRLDREHDWGWTSEPDLRGNTQRVTRTKLLGGTSWLTRFAPRGHPADFGAWGPGWAFDEVLPYFTRLEADAEFGAEEWHGDRGPMPVTRYPELDYTEPGAAALAAMLAAGFPEVDDHNRPGAAGAGRMPMSSVGGRRVTTADAYLEPLLPGLKVRAESEVADIVFDGRRASGVRLLGGETIGAAQVVLCAGVYGSPAILMRSGIGAAEHLRALGIEVRAALPAVGENLADHPATGVDCGYRGPAATDAILHSIATFRSSSTPSDAPPDLMIWASDPETDDEHELGVVLLKPRSRGRVRLRSADPAGAPVIELPALSDPYDVARLAEGYQVALDVANRSELRDVCSGPAPAAPEGDLEDFIRDDAYSLPHVVGTCAIGTVVDSRGRVREVEGLTVADASIIPDAPSGFTHFPVIMLAERIADTLNP
jgi:choline dehydrogenase